MASRDVASSAHQSLHPGDGFGDTSNLLPPHAPYGGDSMCTIDAATLSGIFDVYGPAHLTLNNLRLRQGNAKYGGALAVWFGRSRTMSTRYDLTGILHKCSEWTLRYHLFVLASYETSFAGYSFTT
jgi:hypothetical protein